MQKNQNNPANYNTNIVGKWYWVQQEYYGPGIDRTVFPPELDTLSYFEFDANGTFVEDVQFSNGELLYGNYHITGDSLYVKRNEDNAATAYGIKTLTSGSLIISTYGGASTEGYGFVYTMKKK